MSDLRVDGCPTSGTPSKRDPESSSSPTSSAPPLAARLVEPLEQLRALLEDYKRGTQPEPIRAGVGKHKRARDRFEVETIHKTLNVVIGEIDRLQAGRLVDPSPPTTDANLGVLLGIDGPQPAPIRVAAFLRHYASMIRKNERWDIPETMASAYESAALTLARHDQEQAARVDPSPLAQNAAPSNASKPNVLVGVAATGMPTTNSDESAHTVTDAGHYRVLSPEEEAKFIDALPSKLVLIERIADLEDELEALRAALLVPQNESHT